MCEDRDDEYHRIPNGPQVEGACPHCGEDTVVEFTDYELGTYNMNVVESCEHFEDYHRGEWSWKQ